MNGINKRWRVVLGLSTVALSGMVAGLTHLSWAVAGTRTEAQAERDAQAAADQARALLAAKKPREAAHLAEQAVLLRGDVPAYRALLGQSYLASGRFASAAAALKDALTLEPEDGRTALNLALAQIAAGNWASARETLDNHGDHIPASDRGLAIALAGDPTAAVDLLTIAARATTADAKTRQNLALAYALSGRWAESRAVASVDLSPADVDGRMAEWAAFAKPTGKADQVAALLGVRPANDLGLPVELALNVRKEGPSVAKTDPTPTVPVVTPLAPAAPVQPPVAVAQVSAPMTSKPTVTATVFGPRKEIVQPLPAVEQAMPVAVAVRHAVPARQPVLAADTDIVPVAKNSAKLVKAAIAPVFGKGEWYVQLGAYDNAAVARDAWMRATRHFAGFQGQTPSGKATTVNARTFYRLSVGGFDRASAAGLCKRYRHAGGTCFVRAAAGDQWAEWTKRNVQVAAR